MSVRNATQNELLIRCTLYNNGAQIFRKSVPARFIHAVIARADVPQPDFIVVLLLSRLSLQRTILCRLRRRRLHNSKAPVFKETLQPFFYFDLSR